ncbi:MAG: phage tail protein [Bacteroidetes bacterium]|nr:phage tail protein [Bacteroidota bacterium]
MTGSYISEIQIFSFPFAPRNWAQCNGQVMNISQNQALFALLGTQFGGNGVTTFNLPDLRGRTPIGAGNAPYGTQYNVGAVGGEENHTLTVSEMPAHNHQMMGTSNTADATNADTNLLAKNGTYALFTPNGDGTLLASNFIAQAGNNIGHNNIQPYLALNFCIALAGIFPSRN